MSPRIQTLVLQITIYALCIVAFGYCSVLLLAFLAGKGITFKDFDGAAWTQAVGSVVAICVAIWLGQRQALQAEKTASLRDATAVRVRAAVIRSVAQCAREAFSVVYRHVERVTYGGEELHRIIAICGRCQQAISAMKHFTAPQMVCASELVIWTDALHYCAHLGDLVSVISDGQERGEMLLWLCDVVETAASRLDTIASHIEQGEMALAEEVRLTVEIKGPLFMGPADLESQFVSGDSNEAAAPPLP